MPDFLVMPYRECDFLCPKDEFVASTMRVVEDGRVRFGPSLLPELDLAVSLRTLFPAISTQNSGLSLICATDRIFPGRSRVPADDLTALRVGSESFVASYPFSDFRLLPFLIRERLMRRGVTAVRFAGPKVQYLLDLPSLLGDGAPVRAS
jgi:hypothetical protein